MKKKIAVMGLSFSFLLGGVASAAGINYYAESLSEQKDDMKNDLARKFVNMSKEVDGQIRDESSQMVEEKRKKIMKESTVYMYRKLGEYQKSELDKTQKEIDKVGDQIQKEINKEIDKKVSDKMK